MKKPYYWKARKGWYINEGKSQRRLGDTQREAYNTWRLEQSRDDDAAGQVKLATIFGKYLQWADRQTFIDAIEQSTVDGYAWYLLRLIDAHPDLWVSDLRPHHISDWIAESGWGAAGERNAISAVKRALNWASDHGLIEKNPIARMKRPGTPRRTTTIGEGLHRRMMSAVGSVKSNGRIDRQFRLVLVAVRHSGGRPQDVARVRVENVDDEIETWTIPEHKKQRATGQPKIVYLSPCLQAVTRIAMHGRTEGPLFRTRAGAVTTNAITCRIRRLRERLGLPVGMVAYSYRHTYITDAIANGVDVATVATLTGTSIGMIQRHYGHLAKRSDHLKSAAAKAMLLHGRT